MLTTQIKIDLTDRLTLDQANYQYSVALAEGKFPFLAIAEDSKGFQVFKCFEHHIIERLGFTIIKKNEVKKGLEIVR